MPYTKREMYGPGFIGPVASYLNTTSFPNLGWNYPTEMQHIVHQHWRSFQIPEIYYNVAFFMAYFVLMLLSIFGNGLVIWIFTTSKNLRTPSNLLILNLAVFDIFMCTNMPQYLINAYVGYMVGGSLGCDIYAVCGGISGMGAAITNACIAYDRYKTISNPIDGRLSFGQIIILILLTWLWATPFSILPFFKIWGRYIAEGFLTTCSFDYLTDNNETRYFVHSIFTWAYCIPMTMICTFYVKLFLHVRDHEHMLAEQAKKMNVKSLAANTNADAMGVEMRIAKAAITIWMLFIIAWTPYATLALMSTAGQKDLITPNASMLPAMFCKLVSCLDPWVYAVSHPKYRLELQNRLPWLGIRERQGTPASANTMSDGGESGTILASN